jgi:hypothetical protein
VRSPARTATGHRLADWLPRGPVAMPRRSTANRPAESANADPYGPTHETEKATPGVLRKLLGSAQCASGVRQVPPSPPSRPASVITTCSPRPRRCLMAEHHTPDGPSLMTFRICPSWSGAALVHRCQRAAGVPAVLLRGAGSMTADAPRGPRRTPALRLHPRQAVSSRLPPSPRPPPTAGPG